VKVKTVIGCTGYKSLCIVSGTCSPLLYSMAYLLYSLSWHIRR